MSDTVLYKGYTIHIENDEVDEHHNPRDWDNVGRMICWHSRYNLGDEQPKETPEEYRRGMLDRASSEAIDAIDERVRIVGHHVNSKHFYAASYAADKRIEKIITDYFDRHIIALDLYLYDHSGITISTGKFSCPWDSGRVGFVYCTLEKAHSEWPGTDEEVTKRAIACMESEVQSYDDYLTGDIWRYHVTDPECEDTDGGCGGYFPNHDCPYGERLDYMISDAKSHIDWCIKDRENNFVAMGI